MWLLFIESRNFIYIVNERDSEEFKGERKHCKKEKSKEMRGSDWIPIWLSPCDCFWIIWVGLDFDPTQFHQYHFKSPTNQFWQSRTQFHINQKVQLETIFYLCFSLSFIFLSPFFLLPLQIVGSFDCKDKNVSILKMLKEQKSGSMKMFIFSVW